MVDQDIIWRENSVALDIVARINDAQSEIEGISLAFKGVSSILLSILVELRLARNGQSNA